MAQPPSPAKSWHSAHSPPNMPGWFEPPHEGQTRSSPSASGSQPRQMPEVDMKAPHSPHSSTSGATALRLGWAGGRVALLPSAAAAPFQYEAVMASRDPTKSS